MKTIHTRQLSYLYQLVKTFKNQIMNMQETWYLTGLEATIYLHTFGSNHHLYQKSGKAMLESGVTPLAHPGGGGVCQLQPHHTV